MKKALLILLPAFLLLGCSAKKNESSQRQSGDESLKLVVDYQDDGGANIPLEWNTSDTADTARKATYRVDNQDFSIEFVGQWRNSTSKEEFQTKKENPVSYIRAASDLVVKKIEVEVFEADIAVYTTRDHSGTKVNGTDIASKHSDGTAWTYDINSKDWSILAVETYKGSNVNFYSFTFYF